MEIVEITDHLESAITEGDVAAGRMVLGAAWGTMMVIYLLDDKLWFRWTAGVTGVLQTFLCGLCESYLNHH